MEDVFHVLVSYLNIGSFGRLCLTNKEMYGNLDNSEFVGATLVFSHVILKNKYSIQKLKLCKSRCNECGKLRHVSSVKRTNNCPCCYRHLSENCPCSGLKLYDSGVCTECARTKDNFRYLLFRDEAYKYVMTNANGNFIVKKSKFFKLLSTVKPRMITRTKKYMYRPRDILHIGLAVSK